MEQKHSTTNPQKNSQPAFFSVPQLVLAVVMVVFCSILINVEMEIDKNVHYNAYASSYQYRIGLYSKKLDSFALITSFEEKQFARLSNNVLATNYIVSKIQPGDTVLLPPMEYALLYQPNAAFWTDPRIFTYIGGFQPIVAYDDIARRNSANRFVFIDGRTIWLARKGGKYNVDSLLYLYSKLRSTRKVTTNGSNQ